MGDQDRPRTARRPALPAPWRPWLDDVRTGEVDGPASGSAAATTVHLPDATTTVVWRRTAAGDGDLLVVGPRTAAAYHHAKDVPVFARLRLRPGTAARVLGVPAAELVDRVVELADLWGPAGRRLAGAAAAVDHDRRRLVRVLADGVLSRTGGTGGGVAARSGVAAAAARLLGPDPRRPSVEAVAARLHVSERHLRDAFREAVGVSPRQYARLERVRAIARAGARPEAGVAAGYYDQSHLGREFRRFMGVTPGAYAAGRLPRPAAC